MNYKYSDIIEASDYLVIDTEGRRELREIAIIHRTGKLVYEALNQEHPEYVERGRSNKSLKDILVVFWSRYISQFQGQNLTKQTLIS